MTRFFCGIWQYKTQAMNYIHIESFLANLILKRRSLYIVICDNNENPITGVRCVPSDVYNSQGNSCISGLVLYEVCYYVKIDSLKNVFLVPVR